MDLFFLFKSELTCPITCSDTLVQHVYVRGRPHDPRLELPLPLVVIQLRRIV